MRSIELRQKILLIRLAGQLLLLNGNQTKERVFLSKLLRIILSGISLANYINGSQIHMLSCHCKNWKTDWMRISTLFMQWLILWVMKNYLNHIWENGLTKKLKQLYGKYTNSYMLIQLLRSEPLEPSWLHLKLSEGVLTGIPFLSSDSHLITRVVQPTW